MVCHIAGQLLPAKAIRRQHRAECHKWKRKYTSSQSPALCYSHIYFGSNVSFFSSSSFLSCLPLSRLDFTLFAITAPALMFSDLQILHLIPQSARPSLNSLVPFTRNSPIRLPRFFQPVSLKNILLSGVEVLQSPIVILWLSDGPRHAVEDVHYHL